LRLAVIIIAPIACSVILIAAGVYSEYPFINIVAVFLFVLCFLLPCYLIYNRKSKFRLLRLIGYIALTFIIAAVLVPSFFTITPGFTGRQFANAWYFHKTLEQERAKDYWRRNFIVQEGSHEIISDDEVFFKHPAPPVVLYISLKGNEAKCIGYPESAEKACNKKLREHIEKASTRSD